MKRYRGSKYSKRRGMFIFGIIALLLVLVAAVAYFLLRDVIVFTPDGLRFTFSQEKEPITNDLDELDPEIIIEPPVTPPVDVPTLPTDTSTTMENAYGFVLTPQKLLDSAYLDSAIALCKTKNLTSITVVIKDESGVVNIPYSGQYLSANGVLADSDAVAQAIKKINDAGLNTVALISACRDDLGAHSFRQGSAGTGKSLWLDRKYIAWFDPYKPQVGEYLTELIDSCSALGISEIIFDNFNFANNGKTEMLNYGEQTTTKIQAMTALASELSQHADGKLTLSALLTETAASTLTDEQAGQDVAALSQHFDRLYAPANSFDYDLTAIDGALEDSCHSALWVSGDISLPDTTSIEKSFMLKNGNYNYN